MAKINISNPLPAERDIYQLIHRKGEYGWAPVAGGGISGLSTAHLLASWGGYRSQFGILGVKTLSIYIYVHAQANSLIILEPTIEKG